MRISIFAALFALILSGSPIFGQAIVTSDPLEIGLGARAIALGGVITPLSEDGNTIYANPAGFAEINNWNISSMYTSLFSDIPYLAASGSWPVNFRGANFGSALSFVGQSTSYLIPTQQGLVSADYHNNVYLYSFGWKASPKVETGLNIKYYDEAFGPPVSSSGSGQEIDFGLKYFHSKDLTLSALFQNILPASLSGKITWSPTVFEAFPQILKLGASKGFLDGKVLAVAESDLYITQNNYPSLIHYGLEWTPFGMLSIRTGIDNTEPTFGMGLNLSGIRFDYAYHSYSQAQGNSTQFFSLSFSPKEGSNSSQAKRAFTILEPDNMATTNNDSIEVKGKTGNMSVKMITANNVSSARNYYGNFSMIVPLNLGQNTITIEALDDKNKTLDVQILKLIRLVRFNDVKEGDFAKDQIEKLATLSIMSGYLDGTFKPDKGITRSEFSVVLKKLGITPTFEVSSKALTRSEAISITAKYFNLPAPQTPELLSPYPDVPGRHWAIKEIISAKNAGLLDFIHGNSFEPNKNIIRAEIAYILMKIPSVQTRIQAEIP